MNTLSDKEIESKFKDFIKAFEKDFGGKPQITMTKHVIESELMSKITKFTLSYLTDYDPITIIKMLQVIRVISSKHEDKDSFELLESRYIDEVFNGFNAKEPDKKKTRRRRVPRSTDSNKENSEAQDGN